MGWKRKKYNFFQKLYSNIDDWIFNNFVMEYLVADAKAMLEAYKNERLRSRRKPLDTRVIYYGTNIAPILPEKIPENILSFFNEHCISKDSYYLMINRLVPENSYEMIINEYMKSDTKCPFIIVTNQEKEKKYYKKLKQRTNFESDKRIQFVGTIFDKTLLQYLRQYARGYINGHTVGGTNPGLLEALATTNINLIRDCSFSREGAADAGLYFDENHPLSELLTKVDSMSYEERKLFGDKAKKRMKDFFSWGDINAQYVDLFNDISRRKGIERHK